MRLPGLEPTTETWPLSYSLFYAVSYGSEEENRLEHALDQHEQMRHRIVEANFKWRQAQLMVDYAYKQLEYAVKKWLEIPGINPA